MKNLYLIAILIIASACSKDRSTAYVKISPATILEDKVSMITRITLTKEAEIRLGLTTRTIILGSNVELPNSSIIFDSDGNCWLYLKETPLNYHRTPITLLKVFGTSALINASSRENVEVVVSGVAELFGTESGVGK